MKTKILLTVFAWILIMEIGGFGPGTVHAEELQLYTKRERSRNATYLPDGQRVYFDVEREYTYYRSDEGQQVTHGTWEERFPDGTLFQTSHYEHGTMRGPYKCWYGKEVDGQISQGSLQYSGNWWNGPFVRDGHWFYRITAWPGSFTEERVYVQGRVLSYKQHDPSGELFIHRAYDLSRSKPDDEVPVYEFERGSSGASAKITRSKYKPDGTGVYEWLREFKSLEDGHYVTTGFSVNYIEPSPVLRKTGWLLEGMHIGRTWTQSGGDWTPLYDREYHYSEGEYHGTMKQQWADEAIGPPWGVCFPPRLPITLEKSTASKENGMMQVF